MSDNDLIRRGDAIALTCDPFGAETVTSQAINAIPAAQPTVKPGEIERAVWGAMGWALRHAKQMPGGIIPAYTDTGNSDAEVECRRSTTRILSVLDMQPTVSPKQLAARPDDVEALLEDFSAVLRYVPDSVVECRGDKCREPWCASCCGWDDAEEAIAVAHEAGKRARAALARVKGVR